MNILKRFVFILATWMMAAPMLKAQDPADLPEYFWQIRMEGYRSQIERGDPQQRELIQFEFIFGEPTFSILIEGAATLGYFAAQLINEETDLNQTVLTILGNLHLGNYGGENFQTIQGNGYFAIKIDFPIANVMEVLAILFLHPDAGFLFQIPLGMLVEALPALANFPEYLAGLVQAVPGIAEIALPVPEIVMPQLFPHPDFFSR